MTGIHNDNVVGMSLMLLVSLLGPIMGASLLHASSTWFVILCSIILALACLISLPFYSRHKRPKAGYPLLRIVLISLIIFISLYVYYNISISRIEPWLSILISSLILATACLVTVYAFIRRNNTRNENTINTKIVALGTLLGIALSKSLSTSETIFVFFSLFINLFTAMLWFGVLTWLISSIIEEVKCVQ